MKIDLHTHTHAHKHTHTHNRKKKAEPQQSFVWEKYISLNYINTLQKRVLPLSQACLIKVKFKFSHPHFKREWTLSRREMRNRRGRLIVRVFAVMENTLEHNRKNSQRY